MRFFIFVNTLLDTFYRIEYIAYGSVVVKCINEKSDVFAHINVDIPRFCQKLLRLIDEVGGKDTVNDAAFVCLVKFFESICK